MEITFEWEGSVYTIAHDSRDGSSETVIQTPKKKAEVVIPKTFPRGLA
jgi:hypothetical protein